MVRRTLWVSPTINVFPVVGVCHRCRMIVHRPCSRNSERVGAQWAGTLERLYTFPDFAQGLSFVNKVGAIAEAEGHHPDLHLAWGKVKVEIWTHKINGLTESDFYLAAKADREFEPVKAGA